MFARLIYNACMGAGNEMVKQQMMDAIAQINSFGLSFGASGNLSSRAERGFLITPTGIDYDDLKSASLVHCDMDGGIISGKLRPSSEWRFHRAIYRARTEINAVVHIHSPYATGIACTRQGIPAFHYMVALAGGNSIPCAAYATFATEELANNVIAALAGRNACLLANHGMVAIGEDISSAFRLALETENLARQYWIANQAGTPVLLDDREMEINLEKFKTYGKQD